MRRKILVIITIFCIGLLPKTIFAETYDGDYSIEYLQFHSKYTLSEPNVLLLDVGQYSINHGEISEQMYVFF